MYNSAEPPHFGLMRWCYIFNCVYHVLGIYELELWLDTCDYEHLIWPQLLLYNTCDVIWYTGLYTYNSELLNPLLDLPASSSYSFGPAPSPEKKAYFFGIRLQLVSEVGFVENRQPSWELLWSCWPGISRVSESGGFTLKRRGDALPLSISTEARSTSRRGGYAAGVGCCFWLNLNFKLDLIIWLNLVKLSKLGCCFDLSQIFYLDISLKLKSMI